MPIPDLVWSGVVGAVCGGLVSVITLWDGRRRLKIQLAHDAKLKAIDREVGMRKDVYSKVAEDVAALEEYVAGPLVQDDPTKPEFLSCRAKLSASLARATPFASVETKLAGAELLAKYAVELPRLLEAAKPFHDGAVRVVGLNRLVDVHAADRDRILAQVRAELDSEAPNLAKVEALNMALDIRIEAWKAAGEEVIAAMEQQTKFVAAYLDVALDFVCLCEPLRVKLTSCMQVDLGVVIAQPDETKLRQLRNAALTAARKSIGAIFDRK